MEDQKNTEAGQSVIRAYVDNEEDAKLEVSRAQACEQIIRAPAYSGFCPHCKEQYGFSAINAPPVMAALSAGHKIVVTNCPKCQKAFVVEKSILIDASKMSPEQISKLGKGKAASGQKLIRGPKNGSDA